MFGVVCNPADARGEHARDWFRDAGRYDKIIGRTYRVTNQRRLGARSGPASRPKGVKCVQQKQGAPGAYLG